MIQADGLTLVLFFSFDRALKNKITLFSLTFMIKENKLILFFGLEAQGLIYRHFVGYILLLISIIYSNSLAFDVLH